MKTLRVLTAASLCLAAGSLALAQRGAASKITGTAYEAPYFYASAGAYQDSAYSHSNLLEYTSGYGEPVVDEVTEEHTAAIRRDLQNAGKKYQALRPLTKNNQAATQHLDAIDKHHKQALSLTDEIDGHVSEGSAAAEKVQGSARKLSEELSKAKAEHDKLMEHLNIRKPAAK